MECLSPRLYQIKLFLAKQEYSYKISNVKKRIEKWQRQKVKQVKLVAHNAAAMMHCQLCHAVFAKNVAKRNVHTMFVLHAVRNNNHMRLTAEWARMCCSAFFCYIMPCKKATEKL